MINGNSKDVNNRHVQFDSIKSLGKSCNEHSSFMASHRKCMTKILIGILCQTFEQKNFEIFLVGQAVLQMSQISRSCVIASMSY